MRPEKAPGKRGHYSTDPEVNKGRGCLECYFCVVARTCRSRNVIDRRESTRHIYGTVESPPGIGGAG